MPGSSIGSIRGTIKIDYDGAGVAKASSDLDKVKNKGKGTGEELNKAGTVMLGAGVAVAGGFALAVKSAANFEQGLSNIKAVSGATNTEMESLRNKALQLGKDTAFSATDAATAMEELVKAGVSTTDVLNGAADAAVALAAAGGIGLPEAATISANAMNQFGLAAKDLPKVVDQIAGAANASAIDVSEFGMSLSQVGAVAHLAGLSFNDTATAIALMGNAGIKGSDAGTSLKTFLQNLIPTTKEQTKLMQQLGIVTKDGGNNFFDASGKAKSLADISQVLQTALKGQTKEQQLATLQTLFGSDAIRAAAVLADQGAAGFNNMATAMGKVSAADVAATRMDNLNGQLEQMKGSLETAGIAIGTILIPKITSLVKTITGWINSFMQLDPHTRNVIVTIIGIAGAVLVFVGVVIKIIQVVKMFQAAWIALNASFLFTPIGAIITGIVLLIAAIIWIATKTTWFQTIWEYVWGFLKAVGAWFAGPFAGFFVDLWNKIWPVLSAIGSFFKTIWDGIVAAVMWAWNIIKSVLLFFGPLFEAVFGLVKSIVQAAWAVISAIFTVGVALWKAIIAPVLSWIWTMIKQTWDNVVSAIQFAWNLIKAILAFFAPVFQAVFGLIKTIVSTVWSAITAIFQIGVALWKAIILPVLTAIWGMISFYFNAIWSFIKWVWDGVKAAFMAVWEWAAPYVTAAVLKIHSIIQSVLNFISGLWNTVWGGIKSFFSSIWNGITGIVSSAVNKVVSIINGIKAMVDRVKKFFDDLKNAASGGTGDLIAFVKGIPGKILSAIGDAGKMLYESGRKIIQGLVDGIKNMAGKVKDAIADVLHTARNLLPFSPAKEGPFSGKGWTLYSGRSMMDALAQGIDQSADNAVQAMNNAMAGMAANATVSTAGGASQRAVASPVNVTTRPQLVVVADLGDGVRQVVRHEVADNPDLVANSAAEGNQGRKFLSPGRAA